MDSAANWKDWPETICQIKIKWFYQTPVEWLRWPLRGEVKASDGGFGASVIWEPLKVAGGLYRLCWCSGNAQCIAGEDFKVDVGSLTMIGVNMQQDRTCVSGLVCRTEGITGKYLSNEDHFLILETCGVTSSYVEGFPSASSYVASSGASVSFGGQPATAAGGKYQLCWCPGLQTNSKSFFCSDLDCEEWWGQRRELRLR